jgi:ribonucleoside-diphosphate reductase alpha chain
MTGSPVTLTPNAQTVLAYRYLRKDEQGQVVETPEEMFKRVARVIAAVDQRYNPHLDIEAQAEQYYALMAELRFLPNSPTLMNAGTPLGQLAACFVLPVEDNLESIFNAVRDSALIHQSGGGVGYTFSHLRPQSDMVRSTGGVASGPVSFMQVFDQATEVIKQGGRRRGANMGVLRVDHPDILKFIHAKDQEGVLTNFNLSVATTEAFMQAVERNAAFPLRNPRTGVIVRSMPARELMDEIATAAWSRGDPGMIFVDTINRHNPIPHVGTIEATNPCVPGDTWVMTQEGPRQVHELLNRAVIMLLDGQSCLSETGFFKTGVKPVVEVLTKEGFRFRATPGHLVRRVVQTARYTCHTEWVPVGELTAGDKLALNDHRRLKGWPGPGTEGEGYVLGLLIGNGTPELNSAMVSVWDQGEEPDTVRAAVRGFLHRTDSGGSQRPIAKRNETRMRRVASRKLAAAYGLQPGRATITPAMERTSSDFYLGLLRGLFDANGAVIGNRRKGESVRLTHCSLETLEVVQRMLHRLGIVSRISRGCRPEGTFELPDGHRKRRMHSIKAQHELVISTEDLARFHSLVGFERLDKRCALERMLSTHKREANRACFVATVASLTPVGEEEVYDVQVPGVNAFDANGFYVHNCGEQPLLPYESCTLGSINLTRCVHHGAINWSELRRVVRLAVQFLDNVIDANHYPLPQIAAMSTATRKIGLGVMGWADLLIQLGIPYTDPQALNLAETLMRTITEDARQRSVELGRERGSFRYFRGSHWEQQGYEAMRNATVTTIAPTGTLSIIAGTSSGIEPLFAVVYVRQGLDGMSLTEVNTHFLQQAQVAGLNTDALLDKIAQRGSIQHLTEIPESLRRVFVTALDIPPDWHVRMQAAFQRHTDNAVSKTVNLPNTATIEEVRTVYRLAYELGCKGITVFRDGSRAHQVLYQGKVPGLGWRDGMLTVHAEYGGNCRLCSV